MAIDKEKLKQQKKMRKKNLAFKEYRFFTSVPKNSVLIVENSLFKTAKVVSGGFYISFFPFLKTVGVSLETYNYDFPPEKFQAGALLVSNNDENENENDQNENENDENENENDENENENDKNEKYDIIIDAAISYRILGGDKPKKVDPNHDQIPADETIKSVNKSLRRTWREKHGALKVYYDLKNKRESIEKQIQIAVYDTLRIYVATHTYEEILAAQIDENSDLIQEIKQSLESFGIEVVNFKIQKVNQEKSIDENEQRNKIDIDNAKANAIVKRIETDVEVDRITRTGSAENDVLQGKVDICGSLPHQAISAIGGQNTQQVNVNFAQEQFTSLRGLLNYLQQKTQNENLTQEQLIGLMGRLNNLQQKPQNAATSSTTVQNPDSDDSALEAEVQHSEEHNNGENLEFNEPEDSKDKDTSENPNPVMVTTLPQGEGNVVLTEGTDQFMNGFGQTTEQQNQELGKQRVYRK